MLQIILSNIFWNSVAKVFKKCDSIVDALCMVNSPFMGFIYEGVDHCKESVASTFTNVEDEYKDIWEIMHSHLFQQHVIWTLDYLG